MIPVIVPSLLGFGGILGWRILDEIFDETKICLTD